MIVKINENQLIILCAYSLVDNENIIREGGVIRIIGERPFFESLLEKLTGIFLLKGVVEGTDEPNELGYQIEVIIDAVNSRFYISEKDLKDW